MASRRLQKRLEVEAAEKLGTSAPEKAKKEKATAKKAKSTGASARKRKVKAPERKRIVWGVFSGTLKDEGRYPYDQYDKAVERLEQLRAKSKKMFFIQAIKEPLSAPLLGAGEVPLIGDVEEELDAEPGDLDLDGSDEE
jgi:hypothetical protein